MTIRLHNSLTRTIETFTPIEPGRARVYTCGPTVHDFAHIGNFRTFLFEDLLTRVLIVHGYDVVQVMNITDVDDNTIRKANAAGRSLTDYTGEYTEAFLSDLDALRIRRAEHYPRATDHIAAMIEMVQSLLSAGHAYEHDGSIYFRVSSWPEYGALVDIDASAAQVAERIDHDDYPRESPQDFALWKAWRPDDGDVYWESPLGRGRPGWHIECSAMSRALLGEHFDIHTGGVDNKFPHHENEIAQSRCSSHSAFVNYWMHSEHLLVDGEKMSKRDGNFYTLRDLLDRGYAAEVVRYALLTVHYRKQLNFTLAGLDAAATAIGRLRDFGRRLADSEPAAEMAGVDPPWLDEARQAFRRSLGNDLDIAGALGHVFDLVRDVNRRLDAGGIRRGEAAAVRHWLLTDVDGVLQVLESSEADVDQTEALELAEKRSVARASGDWAKADLLRDRIDQLGFIVRDTADGYRLVRKG